MSRMPRLVRSASEPMEHTAQTPSGLEEVTRQHLSRWSRCVGVNLYLSRFPNTNRVSARLVVHRNEAHAFLRVFIEEERLERRLVICWEPFFVLENAVELHLDAAIQTIAHVGDDFHSSVVADSFLDVRARDGTFDALVEQDKLRAVFQVVLVDVARLIRAARMSGDDVARAALGFFRDFHAAGRPHEAESRKEENKFISFHNATHWLLVLVADKYHCVARRVRHGYCNGPRQIGHWTPARIEEFNRDRPRAGGQPRHSETQKLR